MMIFLLRIEKKMNLQIKELCNESEKQDFQNILNLTPRQAREIKADFLQSEKFKNLVCFDGLLNIYFDCVDFSHSRKYKKSL